MDASRITKESGGCGWIPRHSANLLTGFRVHGVGRTAIRRSTGWRWWSSEKASKSKFRAGPAAEGNLESQLGMWRENVAPQLPGARRPADACKGQWAVVDAQGTISGQLPVKDEMPPL